MTEHAVLIVGGGFSGAALGLYLAARGLPADAIALVEPAAALGWGVAYGGAAPEHILNVPAGRMSLWPDRPDDFLEWARQHGPTLGWPQAQQASGASFLPRRLFGHYVAATLAARAPGLRHIRDRVTTLSRTATGFTATLGDGSTLSARQVVLATGYRAPSQPASVKESPDGVGRIKQPWDEGAVTGLGRRDPVLIVGCGLSMIDMLASLDVHRHNGPVTLLSRHGLLPRVHGPSAPVPAPLSLADMASGTRAVLRRLRAAIRASGDDWRSLIDALRPQTDALWAALAPAEQARLLRHLRPYWEVHRHRVPPESADRLLRRLGAGQLTVVAGRLQDLTAQSEGVQARWRRRGAATEETHYFARVINCLPPAAPLSGENDLLNTLAASGLIQADPSGLGLDVDADGALAPGLYAVAALRRGRLVETTAVPDLRGQLLRLAERL